MENKYSTLAISPEAHRIIKTQAAKEGVSIISLVERVMKEYIEKQKAAHE